jgi:membrane protein implicated in regulation of membrane protease activity
LKQVEALNALGNGQGKQTIIVPAAAIEAFGDAFKLLRGDLMAALWWVWVSGGVLLGIIEVFAPGFFFLGFSVGAVITGLVLLAGGPFASWLAGSVAYHGPVLCAGLARVLARAAPHRRRAERPDQDLGPRHQRGLTGLTRTATPVSTVPAGAPHSSRDAASPAPDAPRGSWRLSARSSSTRSRPSG